MADITEVPGLAEDEFLMLPEKILMKIIRYSSNPDRKNIGLKHTALRFFFPCGNGYPSAESSLPSGE